MKVIVQKLSGFAKFELDHKVNCSQFVNLINTHIEDSGEDAEQEAAFDKVCEVFNKAFVEGVEPFKGDLENDTYKELLDVFRTFKPTE